MLDRGDLAIFFIAGSRRCGSTWLQSMLAMHPQIIVRNEGRFFRGDEASIEHWLDEDLVAQWARTPAARDGWLRDIEVGELQPILIRGMVEAVLREAIRRTKWKNPDRIKAVGNKTTVHLLDNIELVHTCFPDAKLIHLVRDGRDVVVSDLFMRFASGSFEEFSEAGRVHARAACDFHAHSKGEAVDLLCSDTLEPLARTWARVVGCAMRARELYQERFLEVRYEDLLDRPEGLGALLAFLGVDDDPALVARIIEATSFAKQSGGRARGQADPLSLVRQGTAGDWQRWFTRDNRRVFAEVAGAELIAQGYEADEVWVDRAGH